MPENRRILNLIFGLSLLGLSTSPSFANDRGFSVDHYFKLKSVSELALSSDGKWVAYFVETPSLVDNKTERRVLVRSTATEEIEFEIPEIQAARQLAWIPGTHELAYLSSEDSVDRILSIDVISGETKQHTQSVSSVESFRFSPDGASVAWLTRPGRVDPPPFSERLLNGSKGLEVNVDKLFAYHFVNPDTPNPDFVDESSTRLWIRSLSQGAPEVVDIPGTVANYYWSSKQDALSVRFTSNSLSNVRLRNRYTSIGVYDVASGEFNVIFAGSPSSPKGSGQIFFGGEWLPSGESLFVRRIREINLLETRSEWAIVNVREGHATKVRTGDWNEFDGSPSSTFIPVNKELFYLERTIRAQPSLYRLTSDGFELVEAFEKLPGSERMVRFADNFDSAVFVNESTVKPPEIYHWQRGQGSSQLTRLNTELESALESIKYRRVEWSSDDGTKVQGWLLEPNAHEETVPRPLITFIHGGPCWPYTDQFAPYFSSRGGIWPYPLEAYVDHGMAVFVPNYRGTCTFGSDFSRVDINDGQPFEDIVSGIDHVISEGIADPERLGISGHSHGSWLGALVMTRQRTFTVASFAEGTINKIINYSLTSGWLNRERHHRHYGAEFDKNLARYVEISPDMHFEGLSTAVLLEAGAELSGIHMMGSAKAAVRAGMPTQYIVYPNTAHTMDIPSLKRESAKRNLDWFRFWLQGNEDSYPTKAEQFNRWREMRAERCSWDEEDKPSYCEAVH